MSLTSEFLSAFVADETSGDFARVESSWFHVRIGFIVIGSSRVGGRYLLHRFVRILVEPFHSLIYYIVGEYMRPNRD